MRQRTLRRHHAHEKAEALNDEPEADQCNRSALPCSMVRSAAKRTRGSSRYDIYFPWVTAARVTSCRFRQWLGSFHQQVCEDVVPIQSICVMGPKKPEIQANIVRTNSGSPEPCRQSLCTASTSTPDASSFSTSPPDVGSITASSVTIRSTLRREVMGKCKHPRSSVALWRCASWRRSHGVRRSRGPWHPPSRGPCCPEPSSSPAGGRSTCKPPSTVTSRWPPRIGRTTSHCRRSRLPAAR